MATDLRPFIRVQTTLFEKNFVAYANLANVVKQSCHYRSIGLQRPQAKQGGQLARVFADAVAVTACRRVLKMHDVEQHPGCQPARLGESFAEPSVANPRFGIPFRVLLHKPSLACPKLRPALCQVVSLAMECQ